MKHKKLIIIGGIILVALILLFVAAKKKANQKKQAEEELKASMTATEDVTASPTDTTEQGMQEVNTESNEPTDSYKQSLGLDNVDKDQRVHVDRDEPTEAPTEAPKQTEPTYAVTTKIFDYQEVPAVNMDGSRCKDYYAKVKLSDFGSFWGTGLTEEDFIGHKKYLVGVDKYSEPEKGDFQSVGWLIDKLNDGKLQANDCLKFTSLHVIGSLASDHVALLCSYDWYSAFGLDDTLVVFEDISGTLSPADFKDGDVFSASIFVHNTKVIPSVAGKRVVVVQYALYDTQNEPTTQEPQINDDAKSHMQD